MSSFEPETSDAVEVVAPAQDGHVPKLCVGPAGEVVLATLCKVVAADERAQALAVELEDDVPAAEDEQVRVLGDDCIDVSALFEVCELRVCFVRRNNVLRTRLDVSTVRVLLAGLRDLLRLLQLSVPAGRGHASAQASAANKSTGDIAYPVRLRHAPSPRTLMSW